MRRPYQGTGGRHFRSVLITGAGGFLGSYLTRAYAADGIRVTALVRAPPRDAVSGEVRHVSVDLLDRAQTRAVCADHDLVVHVAAVRHADHRQSRDAQAHANVQMTANVIGACKEGGVGCLVHVSSTAAIGISSDPRQPADEASHLNPELAEYGYPASKWRSERLALEANGPGLAVTVVNPGFMFGSSSTGYRGADVIERVLGRRVVFCTPGGLSIVHVQDVTAGIRKAASRGRPGERYILAGENVTFRAIAETVCEVAGARRLVLSLPASAGALLGALQSIVSRARQGPPRRNLQRRLAFQFYSSHKAAVALDYVYRPFSAIVRDYLNDA